MNRPQAEVLMRKSGLLVAVSLLFAATAALYTLTACDGPNRRPREHFLATNGLRFVIDGRPFRFVGANVAVLYRDEDRARMPETLARAAQAGIRVIRVWASGEGGPGDVKPIADFADWPRNHSFRRKPGEWNEDEFVFLDRVIAEAARNGLRVQLCLGNWWRDTGGVTQYLRWAGIAGADDDAFPFGINSEKAMQFYTNARAKLLYRQHLEKIATRRNTITGILYREDPAIFGYELMNEAQCLTGRWTERRQWLAEMSTYLKSLDPDHLIAPGDWGYRSAAERREWLLDHNLPNIDYCDVHIYPKDDKDSFVDSPKALEEFIQNREAAAAAINRPLVLGEFGMSVEGYKGVSQLDWFRAYFENAAREGVAGAIFWILTPDQSRGYGVAYPSSRDAALLTEFKGYAHLFASLVNASPPPNLLNAGKHLVPRQFSFTESDAAATQPQVIFEPDGKILYRFWPNMAVRGAFEKIGGGQGYVWGAGAGFFEYVVPARNDHRRVGQIVVRAHLQPVAPVDAPSSWTHTRVTLFVDGTNCGSRLVATEDPATPMIQEWRVNSWIPRLRAARGLPFTIAFAVTTDSDWLYGLNISNWAETYDARGASPLEVRIDR